MKNKKIFRFFSLCLLAGIFVPNEGAAQTFTASIVGTIRDDTGGVLPGVTVTVENIKTGLSRSGITNDSGNYSIPQLPPSEYKVSTSLAGFKKETRTGIVLQVGQEARMDFILKVGEITEEVVVQSGSPLVQTENASLSSVIDEQKVVEMPLNGREFYQLAQLAPNVSAPAQNSTLSFRGGFNVAGNSEIANNFSLDGTDNNDEGINGPTFRPSIDAIKEFRVMTGTYNAEYGRNSGGQVVVTTKSGTNEFHGTLFEFHRNSALDARSFFSPRKPAFRRNQFGGTAGGPILKDRTFFFVNYEGLRLGQQVSRLTTVPTERMKSGDFSELLTLPTPIRIVDPNTGQTFPANRIPPERLDAIGRALVAFYPNPNQPGLVQNYAATMLRNDRLNQFSVKIDQRISGKNNFFAGFSLFNDTTFEPSNALCGAREIPGFGCTTGLNTRHLSVSDTHVISPNLMHEFRFGYNRLRQPRTQQDLGIDFNGQFGIPASPIPVPRNTGLPLVIVTGFASLGLSTNLPQDRADNTYQWVDNIIYNVGNHSVKAGADIRRFQINLFFVSFGRGRFDFLSGFAGHPLANLLLGLPNRTFRAPGNPVTYTRTTSYDFYVQDDWKVSPSLTLNAGLRYELNIPLIEKSNNIGSFDPNTGRLVQAGRDGFGRHVYDTDYKNLAPRFGIAWRPFGNNRTVLRSGFGLFYNIQASGNGLLPLYIGPPMRLTQTFISNPRDPIRLLDPFPDRAASTGTLSPNAIDKHFRTAYTQQWSLSLQRELTPNLMVELGYLGLKGTHLPRIRNINQPLPGPGLIDARRPYPNFGNVSYRESSASSAYHGLQVRVERRSEKGLALLASYTFSKSIDDSPGISTSSDASNATPQNNYYLRGERGLSDFNTRHRLVFSYIYQLPFGPGRPYLSQASGLLGTLLGGWEIAGISTLQSGRPYTPVISADNSNTGNFNDRPNRVGDPNLDDSRPERWLNRNAFAQPPRFAFGNAGRNILIGDGIVNFDIALIKRIQFTENKLLQFRAEFFNAFNHPNFSLPENTFDSARFGTVPSTSTDPRNIQFGLKIIF